MQALIFAAGKGERMRPLTDHTPKPLLQVNGKALIDYHLEKLAEAGFTRVLINLAYLADTIEQHCGTGRRYGLHIDYSHEGPEPFETGGAIHHALPWFQDKAFAAISADVFTDLPFAQLTQALTAFTQCDALAHLWLVNNPAHHPAGDFHLQQNLLDRSHQPRLTYSGISLLKPRLIERFPERRERFPLRDALFWAMQHQQLTGQHWPGMWSDVGTPERLEACQSK